MSRYVTYVLIVITLTFTENFGVMRLRDFIFHDVIKFADIKYFHYAVMMLVSA